MTRTRKIISISIFSGALVAILLLLSGPIFNLDLGLVKDKITTGSTATLVQVRDILALNTVEVVHKAVFPYDYIPADMDWNLFLKQKESRIFSLLEQSYIDVYDLCEQIGIEIDGSGYEFVVVTVILKGGFDLSNPVYRAPQDAGELADHYVFVDEENGITVTLPDPIITNIIIEDAETETYAYPDIRIDPDGWKKLTSFVKDRVTNDAVNQGILEIAEKNGQIFIEKILLDSGYSSVSFR